MWRLGSLAYMRLTKTTYFNEMNTELRAKELCSAMERIVGVKDVTARTRMAPYPMLRAMIWTQLAREGYKLKDCGRIFDKDRATVIHMVKKWTTIISERLPGWDNYISIWDAFQRDIGGTCASEPQSFGERLTVALLQVQMQSLPPDATVLIEPSIVRSLRYDNELNTLIIRG